MLSMILALSISPAPADVGRPHLLARGGCAGSVAAARAGCQGSASQSATGCQGTAQVDRSVVRMRTVTTAVRVPVVAAAAKPAAVPAPVVVAVPPAVGGVPSGPLFVAPPVGLPRPMVARPLLEPVGLMLGGAVDRFRLVGRAVRGGCANGSCAGR